MVTQRKREGKKGKEATETHQQLPQGIVSSTELPEGANRHK